MGRNVFRGLKGQWVAFRSTGSSIRDQKKTSDTRCPKVVSNCNEDLTCWYKPFTITLFLHYFVNSRKGVNRAEPWLHQVWEAFSSHSAFKTLWKDSQIREKNCRHWRLCPFSRLSPASDRHWWKVSLSRSWVYLDSQSGRTKAMQGRNPFVNSQECKNRNLSSGESLCHFV